MNKGNNKKKESGQATLKDVAQALGISISTVSRALNGRSGVGPALKSRIERKARQMNYVPNAAARDLTGARSKTVACVFQDLNGGWLVTVFRGALFRCAGQDYQVITQLSTRAGDELDVPMMLLAGKRFGGLLWFDPRVTAETVEKVQQICDGPIVLIQNYFDLPGVDSVSIENEAGAYLGMEHLLALGNRRILLVRGNDGASNSQKMRGVENAARANGFTITESDYINGYDNGWLAVQALEDYLSHGHVMPEAIFAFNDDMALAILHMLREQQIRVPEEVALVGFDGIHEAVRDHLTTVDTPMSMMGEMAAQILMDRMENRLVSGDAQHILLKSRMRIGKTCGAHLRR